MFAASTERTKRVYVPSGWALRSGVSGLVHGTQPERTVAPRISRHSEAVPGSPVQAHVGVVSVPTAGGVVVNAGAPGAPRSRSYEVLAAGPVFRAASVARARKV